MDEKLLTKRINFLLGKNGCGKSVLLRDLDQRLRANNDWFVRYITPERGGTLAYNPGVDNNVSTIQDWLADTRRKNRFDQFREQTMSQFRRLELGVLREIEKEDKFRSDRAYTFDTVIDKINGLLPLIRLTRRGDTFEIEKRADGTLIKSDSISSGESEAIALAIEALVFSRECQLRPNRLLLIDEPDVHLHPDLQAQLIRFLTSLATERDFKLLIATHSSALLGAIENKTNVQVAFMPLTRGATIKFSPVNEVMTSVIPMFGSHPLSNLFNDRPVMLVEGEDDKRIWDQVVRTSGGQIALFPCAAGSVEKVTEWETWLIEILPSLYDSPEAFSLRDRDDAADELEDRTPVTRCRLHCRNAENLILTDETLSSVGMTFEKVAAGCRAWLKTFPEHPHFRRMDEFVSGGFDRSNADLKDIRNVLTMIIGTSKPWEVLVGQAIASLDDKAAKNADSLRTYLGEKTCFELLDI